MLQNKASTALLASLALLAGCAVDYVQPEHPEAALPAPGAGIASGPADRAAVRAQLGTPLLSSAYWGFDLFRADTLQSNTVIALTPWPIPFARIEDQLQRFTLVAYDRSGQRSAVASGLFRRPADWRRISPIRNDFPALHLRADGLMLYLDPEGAREANLLAAPALRDAHLRHARAAAGCTAVIGCGNGACGDQLATDGAPPRPLPLRGAHAGWLKGEQRQAWLQDSSAAAATPWLETLVALPLPPGAHVLEFSARHAGGRHRFDFTCSAGEVAYLSLRATESGGTFKPTLSDWQVERSDSAPASFAGRPLVLVNDGQWYVEAGPPDD